MRIQTTAPDRKTLARALAERLEEEVVYSGPPSFAYTIGRVTVEREGMIILPDDMNPVAIQRFLVSKGYRHVGTWAFEQARKLIDRIAGNGWRVPYDIQPGAYEPNVLHKTLFRSYF